MCFVTYKPGFTNLSKFYWLRLFQITFYAMQRSNVFRVLIMCHLDLYLAIGSFWKWTPGKKLNTKNALLIERKTSPGASRHRTFLLSAWTNRKGVPYEFRHRHLSYVIVFPMSTVISDSLCLKNICDCNAVTIKERKLDQQRAHLSQTRRWAEILDIQTSNTKRKTTNS